MTWIGKHRACPIYEIFLNTLDYSFVIGSSSKGSIRPIKIVLFCPMSADFPLKVLLKNGSLRVIGPLLDVIFNIPNAND